MMNKSNYNECVGIVQQLMLDRGIEDVPDDQHRNLMYLASELVERADSVANTLKDSDV